MLHLPEESSELLEQKSPEELTRLLDALHQAEANLLAVMSRKGIAPPKALKASETETIKKALAQCQGNITETARALGIARNTLYRKIRQLELME